jgi:hypothetical protein
MADVTISNLTYSLPSSSAFIPFTDNGVTLKVSPSGLYAKPGNTLLVGGESLADLFPTTIDTRLLLLSTYSAVIRGGWLLSVTDRNTSWGDTAARIGVLRSGAGNGWWLSHNLDGSGAIHQSTQGDRLLITSAGYVKTPYQAGFKATITAGTISTGQTVLWNSVEYQTPDNSFNTSTGEWTVPQTGRYLICVGLISVRNTTNGDWYIDILVNGATVTGGRFYTSKSGNQLVHAQLNSSGIFKLNTGDKIKTLLTSSVGDVAVSSLHNLFCAELLG